MPAIIVSDADGFALADPGGALLYAGFIVQFEDAQDAIVAYVVEQWAASGYGTIPVLWENGNPEQVYDTFIFASIEGVITEKTVYGSSGKRNSVRKGIVYYDAYVPQGTGTAIANRLVSTMGALLELRYISPGINMGGAEDPTPGSTDDLTPTKQPGGNYYRVSGNVPFVVISSV